MQAADQTGQASADRPACASRIKISLPAVFRFGSGAVAQPCPPSDGSNEAVAVLGDRFDETGPRGIVAELPAQGLDALGQRLVGDRNAAPYLVEESIL